MPTGQPKVQNTTDGRNMKRKRSDEGGSKGKPTEQSTIIFAATKHHVDYLAALLRLAGYAVSHAYGALDQVARNTQVEEFRTGVTNILVVTDVAARGIDIPILANVVNYDFPSQPKIFVHRVGRTARAGQRGWSFSLVRDTDVPYLLDLQLFLGRRLLVGECNDSSPKYNQDIIVGALPREGLEPDIEWVTKITREDDDLAALKSVAAKGEKLYIKTRNSASSESVKRAKEIIVSPGWSQQNILTSNGKSSAEQARSDMLARISGFRPQETIFEVGTKAKTGNSEIAEMMKCRRKKIIPRRHIEEKEKKATTDNIVTFSDDDDPPKDTVIGDEDLDLDDASEDEIEITFSKAQQKGKGRSLSWKDTENFMSYTPKTVNVAEERGYGVHSGQDNNFVEAARNVVMDLNNDDGGKSFAEPARAKGMRWDKKNSKYVMRANDEDGSKGAKMIRGESGQKIAASFQSGRFDRWRKANRVDRPPRTGEAEISSAPSTGRGYGTGARYRHRQEKAPKEADRYRDDYHVRKKRVAEAQEKRVGKWKDGAGKAETRTPDEIHRERKLAERKKAKNARPSRKGRS